MLDRRIPFVLLAIATACGTKPPPRDTPSPAPAPRARAVLSDDCAPENGVPAEPLARAYDGVAAKARCQREVYTIMGGVVHALGVPCEHCHVPNDHRAMTHRKHVANWMARELIPSLEKRAGGETWCPDCHVAASKGRAKILGNPRSRAFAIEWMSTHLVERFDTTEGDPLRCKMCHGGNLGTPEFRAKVILGEHLPPKRPEPAPATEPTPAPEPAPAADPLPATEPAPDGG